MFLLKTNKNSIAAAMTNNNNTGQHIFVRQVKITFLNKFLRAEPKSLVRFFLVFVNFLRYDQINSPKQLKNVIFSGLFSKNRVSLLKSIDRYQL
jgi:hypothetical protein